MADDRQPPNFEPTLPLWPTVSRSVCDDYGVFHVERVERRSPHTDQVGTYHVIHAPRWANVVALTPEREVVLVEQYRHGLDTVTLEIPGGMVEEGEDAAVGAARELREETGYSGDAAHWLGTVHPNPAIQSNECSTWLIENAWLAHRPDPDEDEHLRVVTVPLERIPDLIGERRITHTLVISAFLFLDLHHRRT